MAMIELWPSVVSPEHPFLAMMDEEVIIDYSTPARSRVVSLEKIFLSVRIGETVLSLFARKKEVAFVKIGIFRPYDIVFMRGRGALGMSGEGWVDIAEKCLSEFSQKFDLKLRWGTLEEAFEFCFYHPERVRALGFIAMGTSAPGKKVSGRYHPMFPNFDAFYPSELLVELRLSSRSYFSDRRSGASVPGNFLVATDEM